MKVLELLKIYKFVLPASISIGLVLAIVGAQLNARKRSVQTLVVSQGSTFGVLIGLCLIQLFQDSHDRLNLLPFICAFAVAWLAFLFSRKSEAADVGLFSAFLAFSYWVTSTIPHLESHMTLTFFGDLAVMNDTESAVLLVYSIASLIYIANFWKPWTEDSFQISILNLKPKTLMFDLFVVLTLVLSIQFTGLLFTLTCIIFPSLLFRQQKRGLRPFLIAVCATTIVAVTIGFLTSLHFGTWPTVPTITLAMLAIGIPTKLLVS